MSESMWLVLGFAGQACFFGRFLLQWIRSEQLGRSVIPVGFWYMSLAGSLIVLIYAVHRRDPVFIIGQTTGAVVYIRNLVLIREERRTT